MPNHHPSRSWRGCAMCKMHKRRGAGRAVKDPIAVVRKLGKRRRLSRRQSDVDLAASRMRTAIRTTPSALAPGMC